MSALVVDTSSWVSYFAGHGSGLIDDALAEGRVFLPPVVAAELVSGVLRAADRREIEGLLSRLPLCGTDLAHWLRAGTLRSSLRAKGLAVSTPDAHVAQCSIDLGGSLLTEDHVFNLIARHCALRPAGA